jgi:hypothetical protein
LQGPTKAIPFAQDVTKVSITERPSLGPAALKLRAMPQLIFKNRPREPVPQYKLHLDLFPEMDPQKKASLLEHFGVQPSVFAHFAPERVVVHHGLGVNGADVNGQSLGGRKLPAAIIHAAFELSCTQKTKGMCGQSSC